MAKILRFQEPLRFEPVSYRSLDNIPVFIQDDSATSYDYFGITESPTVLTAGKNLLSFTGTKNLVSGAEIAIEVLDANGNLIPVRTYDHIGEGNERVFSIEVNNDTPEGDALITLVSVAKGKVAFDKRRQRDLSELTPRSYADRFNIRWQKRINCYPRRRNTDAISFFPNPDITVQEVKKPYFELNYNQRLIKYGTTHASASIYFDNNFQANDEVRIQVDSSASAWRFIACDSFSTPEDTFPIIFWPTSSTLASSVEYLAQEIQNSPLQISTSYENIGGLDWIHMTASYAGDEPNQWTVYTGSHVEWASSPASASFRFANSASNGSIIRLISDDGTTKSYYATSSAASAGDIYGGFNLYQTGSSKLEAARNLSQSISHVNGHNNKISASANSPLNGYVKLWMQHPAANGAGHQNGNTDIFTQSFNGTHADGTVGLDSWNATFDNSIGFPVSFSGGLQSGSKFTQSLAQSFKGGAYQFITGGSNTKASYTLCSATSVGGWNEQTGSTNDSYTPISGAYQMGAPANTTTKLRYEVEGDKYFVYVAGDIGADFGGFTEDMVGGTLLFPKPNNPQPSSFQSIPGTETLAPPTYNEKEDGDGHAFYSESFGSSSVFHQGAYDTFIMERISPFQIRVNSPHTTFQGLTRSQEREVFHQKFDESDWRLDWAQEPISHSNSMNQVYREGGKDFLTSYAKIEFNNLTPLVGDITRIKTYMRNDQTVNDFIMMGDNPVFAQELLFQSQSLVERKPAGDFSKFGFSNYDELYNYWEILGPPSSSSGGHVMDSPELALYNMQTVALNNPIKESLQVGDGVYQNTVYNLNGDNLYARLFSKIPIEFRKDQYYQLEFNAYAININPSLGDPNLEVYIDGAAMRSHGNIHGARIGEIKDINNRELIVETDHHNNKKFKPVKFTFKADATEYAYLHLKINRGLWYFSDISIKPYSQFGHTPHRFDIILPTQKADVRKWDAIDFRFEFYNDDHKKAVYTSEIHNVEFENIYSLIATNAFFQNAEIKNFIGETPLGDNDWAYAAIGTQQYPTNNSANPYDNPGAGVTYMPSITGSIFHHGRVGIGGFYHRNIGDTSPPGPYDGLPIFDGYTPPSPPGWGGSPVHADLHIRKIQPASVHYTSQGEGHNPFGGGSSDGTDASILVQNIGGDGSSILTLDSDAVSKTGSSKIIFLSRGGISQSVIGSTNVGNNDADSNFMDGTPGGSFVMHDVIGNVFSIGVRGNSRFHIVNGLNPSPPHADAGSNVVLIGHRNPLIGNYDHRLDISGSQIIRSGTLWLPDAYVYPDTKLNDPPYILGTDATHSVIKIPHAELCMDDDWYIQSTFISQSRTGSYGKMVGIFDAPYGTTQAGSPQDPSVNSLIFNISQSGLVSKVRFEGIPLGDPTDVIGVDAAGMLYLTGSDILRSKHVWYDGRESPPSDDPNNAATMSHNVGISGSLHVLGIGSGHAGNITASGDIKAEGNIEVDGDIIGTSGNTIITNNAGGYIEAKSNSSNYGLIIRDNDSSDWANIDNNSGYLRLVHSTNTANQGLFIKETGIGTNVNRVGINTNAPDDTLHINGTFKLVDGTQQNTYVLTSDANGVGTWQASAGGGSDLDWVQYEDHTAGPTAFSMSAAHSGSTLVGYDFLTFTGAAGQLVSSNFFPRTHETLPALIVRGRIEQDLGNSNFGNVVIGLDAAVSCSLGSDIGLGLRNTGMHYNVILGAFAAKAANNYLQNCIIIGHNAGPGIGPLTSGTYRNVIIGASAGSSMNAADDNIGIGHLALAAMTDGLYNTAVGGGAGREIIGARLNTFIGYSAGSSGAGDSVSTGGGNIFIGANSGIASGDVSDNLIIGSANSRSLAPIGGQGMNTSTAQIEIHNRFGINCEPEYALDVRCLESDLSTPPVRIRNLQHNAGYIMVWDPNGQSPGGGGAAEVHYVKSWVTGNGNHNQNATTWNAKSPTIMIVSGAISFIPESEVTNSSTRLFENWHTQIKTDPLDDSSFLISGSSDAKFYLSGSGEVGIGTTDPQQELDFRADTFQIQRRAERKGIKLNNEGNIETFDNDSTSAATGSEFIINYSRGVTATAEVLEAVTGISYSDDTVAAASFSLKTSDEKTSILAKGETEGFITPPSTGDVLGSIRWIAQSGSTTDFDSRVSGEAASIVALVSDIDDTGVKGDLSFRVAGKTGAPSQKLLLDADGNHEMVGSLALNGNLSVTSNISHVGDSDTYMGFSDDNIHWKVGNEFTLQSTPSLVVVGDGGNIDLQVKASGENYAIFSEGSSGNVGFGTGTPDSNAKITVVGNISASGTITSTNITASADISSSGTIWADKLILGDAQPASPTEAYNLHIRDTSNVNLVLQATSNGNATIELKNDQTPDWKIFNKFSQGGLRFQAGTGLDVVIMGDDGDVEISQSLFVNSNITASGNIIPASDNSSDLGTTDLRWRDVYSVSTTTGGVFEVGLRTKGLKDLPTGTIVTWKDGKCVPCYKAEDQLVMGVTREGKDEPIVLGAEPILVTGNIKEGEYIVTSDVAGHGKSVNIGYLFKKNLFGKVIGQALESSKGKSSLIKCMIRKM
jgi:hypothetical protein